MTILSVDINPLAYDALAAQYGSSAAAEAEVARRAESLAGNLISSNPGIGALISANPNGYVQNGGFEDDSEGGVFPWTIDAGTVVSSVASLRNGSQGMEVSANVTPAEVSNDLTEIPANTTVRVSYWARSVGGFGQVYARVQDHGFEPVVTLTTAANNTWQQFSFIFTTGDAPVTPKLTLFVSTTGPADSVYVDDVSAIPV